MYPSNHTNHYHFPVVWYSISKVTEETRLDEMDEMDEVDEILLVFGWALAQWLEWLTANSTTIHNRSGLDPSIIRHRGIWGAADKSVFNKVHEKKIQKLPLSVDKQHHHVPVVHCPLGHKVQIWGIQTTSCPSGTVSRRSQSTEISH